MLLQMKATQSATAKFPGTDFFEEDDVKPPALDAFMPETPSVAVQAWPRNEAADDDKRHEVAVDDNSLASQSSETNSVSWLSTGSRANVPPPVEVEPPLPAVDSDLGSDLQPTTPSTESSGQSEQWREQLEMFERASRHFRNAWHMKTEADNNFQNEPGADAERLRAGAEDDKPEKDGGGNEASGTVEPKKDEGGTDDDGKGDSSSDANEPKKDEGGSNDGRQGDSSSSTVEPKKEERGTGGADDSSSGSEEENRKGLDKKEAGKSSISGRDDLEKPNSRTHQTGDSGEEPDDRSKSKAENATDEAKKTRGVEGPTKIRVRTEHVASEELPPITYMRPKEVVEDDSVAVEDYFPASVNEERSAAQPSAEQGRTGDTCTPTCTWSCDRPKCEEVCEPACKAPKCETRCSHNVVLDGCSMDCADPHCMVICPKTSHPSTIRPCPDCKTSCSEPQCKLRCPRSQPCVNVCEHPQCEWKCKAPLHCPKPKCKMLCETPKKCSSTTFSHRLPPPEPGQRVVKSFDAAGDQVRKAQLVSEGHWGR